MVNHAAEGEGVGGNGAGVVKKISGKVFIQTPEQIEFAFETAGLGTRMLAYLIDLAIRVAGGSLILMTIALTTGWAGEGFSTGLILVALFGLEWGYNTVLEWLFNGRTLGKWALGIRVVRSDGVPIDFMRSAMRNLLRAADGFPIIPLFDLVPMYLYATGLLVMFLSGTNRRLGDIAADTMVIREKRVRLKELPPLPDDPIDLPSGVLAQAGIRDSDLALIDEFFRRRHFFSIDRAEELASILAAPVADRLRLENFEPEKLLAGMLIAGHEVRSSWYGRSSAVSIPGDQRGGAF